MLDGYAAVAANVACRHRIAADDQASFLFQAGGAHIEKPVARADFERWLAPELAAIEGAVDQAMSMTGGELLSVKANRNQGVCVVTMLVIKQNGRPKKVRLRIPMDY